MKLFWTFLQCFEFEDRIVDAAEVLWFYFIKEDINKLELFDGQLSIIEVGCASLCGIGHFFEQLLQRFIEIFRRVIEK